MKDYSNHPSTLITPGRNASPIVPNDTTPLAKIPKSLWCGVGGQITMRGKGDEEDTVWLVADRSPVPFMPEYVKATGTDATNLIAIY